MTVPEMDDDQSKAAVQQFWDAHSCGEVYAHGDDLRTQFAAQAEARYSLEPYIRGFAQFPEGRDKAVLEIGVGMGADHAEWAKSHPRLLSGVDLTPRAVEWTRARLALLALPADVRCADAEALPFADDAFDIVYSWGVLHHSPDTALAVREVHRVLKPGGTARVMIYQRRSIIGLLLWLRYGLLAGNSLDWVYAHHLESPGTKAYDVADARAMFSHFSQVTTSSVLSVGDLFEGEAGQRHHGWLLSAARAIWPRRLVRRFGSRYGLFLLIEAVK